jgi:hypothetical protein
MKSLGVLLLSVGLCGGCLESNPQPSPEGDGGGLPLDDDTTNKGGESTGLVDSDRILVSAAGEEGTVLVVGEDGAAEGAQGIEVDYAEGDPPDDFAATSVVDESGGFVLVLSGYGLDAFTLVFKYPDTDETVSVELAVPESGEAGGERPWAWDGAAGNDADGDTPPPEPAYGSVIGEDATLIAVTLSPEGIVTVTGLPFAVTPLSQVVVVNESTPAKAVGQADINGAFLLDLPGQAGDVLRLFAVNPVDHSKATKPMTLSVPTP